MGNGSVTRPAPRPSSRQVCTVRMYWVAVLLAPHPVRAASSLSIVAVNMSMVDAHLVSLWETFSGCTNRGFNPNPTAPRRHRARTYPVPLITTAGPSAPAAARPGVMLLFDEFDAAHLRYLEAEHGANVTTLQQPADLFRHPGLAEICTGVFLCGTDDSPLTINIALTLVRVAVQSQPRPLFASYPRRSQRDALPHWVLPTPPTDMPCLFCVCCT